MQVTERTAPASALMADWPEVREVWRGAPFGAFATVDATGAPQVTPIGSLYLEPDAPRGYFHPIFAARLQKSLREGQRFELLFVDGRARRWLSALITGRFNPPLALRLRGSAIGARRPTTDEERARWQRRVRALRWTRGHDMLWKDVRFVQELQFDTLVPVRFGKSNR